jgi:hypothetical protein
MFNALSAIAKKSSGLNKSLTKVSNLTSSFDKKISKMNNIISDGSTDKETTSSDDTKTVAHKKTTKNGAHKKTTKNVAHKKTTKDGADSEETKDGADSDETKDDADSEETKDDADSEETKETKETKVNPPPIDPNAAIDVSKIHEEKIQREIEEAAKKPNSFLSNIKKMLLSIDIKKILATIDIKKLLAKLPLPPIPVVVAARAATMAPQIMELGETLFNLVSLKYQRMMAEEQKKIDNLQQGGGIQFFTQEECSFF